MGNQLARGVDFNPSDILDGLKPRAPLGGGKGRLLKSLRCISDDGDVVCKMFLKTDERDDQKLDYYSKKLLRWEQHLREQRRKNPQVPSNVCFYSRYDNIPCSKNEMKGAYVMRTFFRYSLQERVMTRPFLTRDGKLWLAYQLLCAVDELHSAQVAHGDLKVENVMVTSTGWLYVTDIAPFKPSHLPEWDPADFSYFFDTAEARHCNLSPERFVSDPAKLAEKREEAVTEQMDVFGAGCAIAQLFLGGEVLFKLDQLLAYKAEKYDPKPRLLENIGEEGIVELITTMLERNPAKRPRAAEVIKMFTPSVFPVYYGDLHAKVVGPLALLTPDKRIEVLNARLQEVIDYVRSTVPGGGKEEEDAVKGAVGIISNVLCATVRHCILPLNRVYCLQLMADIAPHAGDDCNLHMLLPFAVTVLRDKKPLVQATAVTTIATVVKHIATFPPGEANLLHDYVIPAITPLATDPSVVVRASLARVLPELAQQARRFLEARQLLPSMSDGARGAFQEGYDAELTRLQDTFEDLVRQLVLGGEVSSWVTRAFLHDITKLCMFLGRQRTNNFIIPTLTISTLFLNSPDFQVRRDLHRQLVGIALYVGPTFLSYVLPCLKEGLTDVEEVVMCESLRSLSKLCQYGMFDKPSLLELSEMVIPLLLHPSLWIRSAVIEFFSTVSTAKSIITEVDILCFVLPLVNPFLRHRVVTLSESTITAAALPPFPRDTFEDAVKKGSAHSLVPDGDSNPDTALRFQLLQKYVELAAVARRRNEDSRGAKTDVAACGLAAEDVGGSFNLKDLKPLHPVPQRDAVFLSNLKHVEFGIDEAASQSDTTECPSMAQFRPTPRQRKRMQLKASELEKGSTSVRVASPALSSAPAPMPSAVQGGNVGYGSLRYARPTSTLLCQAEEHTATITDLAVHDTLPLFISSSRDTSVRLWDVRTFDKDSALVSPCTYSDTTTKLGHASPVLSVAMLITGTNAAACGTSAGGFTIFCLQSGVVLHGLTLAGGNSGAISCLQRMATSDVLLAGTHNGYLSCVDARIPYAEAFAIKADRTHGPITSLVAGDENGRGAWAVSATMYGYVTLWDLRFRIPVRTWQLDEPVQKLALNGSTPVVLVATSEIQRWSLVTLRKAAVYTPSTASKAPQLPEGTGYAESVDRVVKSIEHTKKESTHTIRAVCGTREADWFITGGTDRRIRYWDSERPSRSYVVCGLEPGEMQPRYAASAAGVVEEPSDIPSAGAPPSISQPVSTSTPTPTNNIRTLRSSLQQHKDAVTALALLRPLQGFCSVPLLVSGSRDGCIKLWQSMPNPDAAPSKK